MKSYADLFQSPQMEERASVYTQKIRDFINDPRRRHILMKNLGVWNQLCSSLDVIEDTQFAIDAYSAGELGTSLGATYLAVYGLLQALFVQQDASMNLCESLGIQKTIDEYPRLKEIRDIRNKSIGHPTKKRRKGQLTSSHFTIRGSLHLGGFTMISSFSDGTSNITNVSVPDLIADQRKYVSEILSLVRDRLQSQERAHKEKFRTESLEVIFEGTNYAFEKINENIDRHRVPGFGKLGLQEIRKTLTDFQRALERRGIELKTYDSINYLYELLEYPLSELEAYLEGNVSGRDIGNSDEAYIFCYFVSGQVKELRDIAKEIDEEYASLPSG